MPKVSDGARARHLVRALEISRSMPYVSGVAWYGFLPGTATGPEWTILDEDLRPNDTYRALAEHAPRAETSPVPRAPNPAARRRG